MLTGGVGNGGRANSGGGHVGGHVGAPYPEYSRRQLIAGLLIFPAAILLIPVLVLLVDFAFNVGG
jgi:hypothetical protein